MGWNDEITQDTLRNSQIMLNKILAIEKKQQKIESICSKILKKIKQQEIKGE